MANAWPAWLVSKGQTIKTEGGGLGVVTAVEQNDSTLDVTITAIRLVDGSTESTIWRPGHKVTSYNHMDIIRGLRSIGLW